MTGPRTQVELSAREREVLDAVGAHLTNAEIASRLFISVRTVESHVAALLRKTGSSSRRELAALAGRPIPPPPPAAALTPFIGRRDERAALATALREHRLVTALGPGGIGKTRLALALAAELQGERAGGSWVVDLVPVTDPARVADAVAAALGVDEQPGRALEESLADRLAASPTLLVLDNCEHVVDAVAAVVERLLSRTERLAILATSRVRLAVPFEWVYPVPGLSVEGALGESDAVELFRARALAAGADPDEVDAGRVAAVCRSLDGLALAIELAAARVPALGMDGLEAGLEQRLDMLAGGRRAEERHRSLRAALDWSADLLDPIERAVLRRLAVFAGPFSPTAAGELLRDWPPVPARRVPAILADLADSSLLVAIRGPSGTRMRCLETVRQYAAEQLEEAGEAAEARARHVLWCTTALDTLEADPSSGDLDAVAVEVRAAVGAEPTGEPRAAATLARRFGYLAFEVGDAREAQFAFERAAALTDDDVLAAELLDEAAGAAEARHFGGDGLELRARAVELASRAGRRDLVAIQLARQVETITRFPGIVARLPPPGTAARLLERARRESDGSPAAELRIRIAGLFLQQDEQGSATEEEARAAAAEARRLGDVPGESAALDALTADLVLRGEVRRALAAVRERLAILRGGRAAEIGVEPFDALLMAVECALAAGDIHAAQELAEEWARLHARDPFLAASRPMLVGLFTGELREAAILGRRFVEGWEQAGRPRATNLKICAAGAAAACALIGDEEMAARLQGIVESFETRDLHDRLRVPSVEAVPLLHVGDVDAAMGLLTVEPEGFAAWFNGLWRPWYAAAWAEAGVLAGVDPAERVERARRLVTQNPVAALLVDRAASLAADPSALPTIADALDAAGARYQAARTRFLAGGTLGRRGEAELAALGAVAAAPPPR